jgi:hypothetical protein
MAPCAPAVDCKSVHCRAEVRMQKSEVTGLSGVAPDCPMQQKDKGLQRSIAPNPNGRADVARTGQ